MNKNFYTFRIFSRYPGLVHAVSVRQLGDMSDPDFEKKTKNRKKFLNLLGLDLVQLVMAQQMHSDKIVLVGKKDRGFEKEKADGLVTGEKNTILGIRSADCLPLLAFDPQNLVLGAVHAGWKGVLKKIGYKLVGQMVKVGSNPKRILVGIGPHICGECYLVEKKRADRFVKSFGNLSQMVKRKKQACYLDLLPPFVNQLIQAGIMEKNIETASLCTVCQNDEFFSFRKEGQPFGEFLSIIAMKEE